MKRERSLSVLSNKSIKSKEVAQPRKVPEKKIGVIGCVGLTRGISPSPASKIKSSGYKQPLSSSRSKPKQIVNVFPSPLKRIASNKSLLSNKQNINTANCIQPKNRTIKNVRIQNTKKDISTSKPVSKMIRESITSKRQVSLAKEVKITIHPPKQHNNNEDDQLLLEQEEPMLRYVPPLKEFKRHSILDFKFLRTTAEKSYFRDVLAFHLPTQCLFTLRIIDKEEVSLQQKEEQLAETLKIHFFMNKFSLPHIQNIYGVIDDPCELYLILEPFVSTLEDGNIFQGSTSELNLSVFSKNMLETFEIIHRERVMFRRLESKFIRKQLGVIKIGLVDSAAYLGKRKRRNSFLGSFTDIPHQLALGLSYNQSCDIWNLGLLLYSSSTGLTPFSGVNLLERIQTLDYDMPMHISKEFGDFLNRLLTEVDKRVTVAQALDHPFVKRSEMQRSLIPRDLWAFWESY